MHAIRCPHCREALKITDDEARVPVKCPRCTRAFMWSAVVGRRQEEHRRKAEEDARAWADLRTAPRVTAAVPAPADPPAASKPRSLAAVVVVFAIIGAAIVARDARREEARAGPTPEQWAAFEGTLPNRPGAFTFRVDRAAPSVTWVYMQGFFYGLSDGEKKDLVLVHHQVTRHVAETQLGLKYMGTRFCNDVGREVAEVSAWSGDVALK